MNDFNSLPTILSDVRIDVRHLPQVPEIKLYLLQDDYPTRNLAEDDYLRLMANPPYWAFCWGGGQALARWVLDNAKYIAQRSVVDFGAGSGVAGIAAALAGATRVLAVDIDSAALQVCLKNARLNRVTLEVSPACGVSAASIMLAADVCYEGEGLEGVMQHLQNGGDLLLAESRLRDISSLLPQLKKITQYRIRTYPDLDESERYDQVDLYSTFIG